MSEAQGKRTSEAAEANVAADTAEAVAAVYDRRNEGGNGDDRDKSGPLPGDSDTSFDAAAEASFLSEARDRGEKVPVRNATEIDERADLKALPPLEDLVSRIPPETRELLDDLFRVKFTTVRRVPEKALKG